jgi:hypothetical protein
VILSNSCFLGSNCKRIHPKKKKKKIVEENGEERNEKMRRKIVNSDFVGERTE